MQEARKTPDLSLQLELESVVDKLNCLQHKTPFEQENVMDENNKRTGTIKGIGDYIYWKFEGLWVGHWKKYPEHLSQGETIAELKEGLLKIYKLVTDVEIL